MLDTSPLGRESLMIHARWGVGFVKEHPAEALKPYHVALCQICGEVMASRETAAGPAMRLLEAVWAMNLRLRFPTIPEFGLWEENAIIHLKQQYEDHEKARHYHVWKGVGIVLDLRKALLGPLPLIGVSPPGLQVETPMRAHQQALFQLDKRWRTLPVERKSSDTWLKTAIAHAVNVPPTVQLLPALVLFSRMIWTTYPKWDGNAHQNARRDFFSHYNRRLWLRDTEMAPLINHLPTR